MFPVNDSEQFKFEHDLAALELTLKFNHQDKITDLIEKKIERSLLILIEKYSDYHYQGFNINIDLKGLNKKYA